MNSSDRQYAARQIVLRCIEDIRALPSFRGQTQIVKALKRVSTLAVWNKS